VIVLNNLISITRANFLPLTVVIVVTNLSAAFYSYRTFSVVSAVLVLVGALLLHASVNAFNNYFDYKSMIDSRTVKTPFSGGVEILVKGEMSGSSALLVAIFCLALAGAIGVYFLTLFFQVLLPLVVFGSLAIVLYTPVISRIHGLSEIIAGSGFGVMGLGTYVTQTGIADRVGLAVFIPVTILVGLLLYLNEFPDVEADRLGGRKHLVILLGKRRAAVLYVLATVAAYFSIVCSIAVGLLPASGLLALMSLPIAYKASRIVMKEYDDTSKLVPALGLNVLMILSTILLLGAGFLIALVV
jgi:1,4-dihydroxy-2-naphthoate octaprenyltransferase